MSSDNFGELCESSNEGCLGIDDNWNSFCSSTRRSQSGFLWIPPGHEEPNQPAGNNCLMCLPTEDFFFANSSVVDRPGFKK